MKKIVALSLAFAFGLFSLMGCGGEKTTGRYNLVSLTTGDETSLMADIVKEAKEKMGKEFDKKDFECYIELVNETKWKMVMYGWPTQGTYAIDGKSIEFTDGNDTFKMTLDEKKITFFNGFEKMIFERK